MIVLIRATGNCVNFPAPPSELAFSAILNKKTETAVQYGQRFTFYKSRHSMQGGRSERKGGRRLEDGGTDGVNFAFWERHIQDKLISRGMEDSSEDLSNSESNKASADCNSEALEIDIEDEQNARAFLRERFLRTLFATYNKPACFSMHEKTQVEAIFRATDIDMENFQVSELQTPMGVLPEALLRSSDVLLFTVDFESN